MREWKLKVNESKTEIMLIKGNLRTNVNQGFGNLDVKASTIVPVNTVRNVGISFDHEQSFKKHIDPFSASPISGQVQIFFFFFFFLENLWLV